MSTRRIPIKHGGKVVGYVNPPFLFRLRSALERLFGRLFRRQLQK